MKQKLILPALLAGIALLSLNGCGEGSNPIDRNRQLKGQKSTQKSEGDQPKNGVHRVDDSNGGYSEITYKDDEKNGVAKTFYPSGKIYKKVHYKDNALHGLAEIFDRRGHLKRSTEYKQGIKHGTYAEYFKSGKARLKINYVKGIPMPGILRRDYQGKKLPEPRIIIDKQEKSNGVNSLFKVVLSMQPEYEEIKFYYLPDSVSWSDLPHNSKRLRYRVNQYKAETNKAFFQHFLRPGEYVTAEGDIYALYELKNGKEVVHKQRIKYSVINKNY